MNPLISKFAEYFEAGNGFKTITEARKFANSLKENNGRLSDQVSARNGYSDLNHTSIVPGSASAKALDEAIEAAVIRVARRVVAEAATPAASFDALVHLYQRQPRLGVRSSTSMRQQAYSTPIPIAYLASLLAGIGPKKTVYEPTAGHGALVLGAAPELTYANELNPQRAADLREQGFRVTEQDAASYMPPQAVDIVIANPPFGRVDGQSWQVQAGPATVAYRTTQIDHAIVFRALAAMQDQGQAVLILPSPLANRKGDAVAASSGYNSGQNRAFYKSLYDNYQVIQHLCIAGDLYARQGTTFPVDLVVIRGRGRSARELPAVDLPQIYTQFAELKELIPHVPDLSLRLDAGGGRREPAEIDHHSLPEPASNQLDAGLYGANGHSDRVADSPAGAGLASPDSAGREGSTAFSAHPAQFSGQPLGLGEGDYGRQSGATGATDFAPGLSSTAASRDGSAQGEASRMPLERVAGTDGRRLQLEEGTVELDGTQIKQVPYRPHSQGQPIGTLVPINLQSAVTAALDRLEQQVGGIDEYVGRSLGIVNQQSLHQRFSAEQIDALGLAFANLAKGEAFIIGDQTGVGKGRFVAGVIEYARRLELVPIFVTQDPKLYGDIMRDLHDIGVRDLNPLATNNGLSVPLPDGTKLRTGTAEVHRRLLQGCAETQDLGEYDAIFTSYSQMQTVRGKETDRRNFLRRFAPMSILILDESHNAGGTPKQFEDKDAAPDRAEFVRQLVERSAGVVYSSATYAKNPYVMTLYSSRTGMRHGVDRPEHLVGMIQSGGIPLQQILAAKLSQNGQYLRRERSYEGIEFAAKVVPVNREIAESLAQVMSRIMEFDQAKQMAIKGLDASLKKEATRQARDASIGVPGASSTNFTAIMHNVINQSLLAMKAEATVQEALSALRQGEKPVITVANTMGSLIGQAAADQELKPGDVIDLSAGDLLRRYLERSREVLLKDYAGNIQRYRLTDVDLAGEALDLFDQCSELIDQGDWGRLPISPIDYIRYRLSQEGVSVNEITGREERIEYGPQGNQVYQTRNSGEKSVAAAIRYVNAFNGGQLDALILNRAGSTGISLHASEKFADQRPRRMIIAQPELNIDQFMQMLGRIHRTGQVEKPRFSILMGDIPAEKRPAAVLLKKMASLNANTTAARDSTFNLDQVTDFMNDYGDQVALEILANRPNLHAQLGNPISGLSDDADLESFEIQGLVSKITGRIPLLPIAEQEKLYELLEREYKDLLEREQAMGQNILEAETLDLDARPLAKLEVFPARIGQESGPFTEPVYLEVLDVKAQRKPLTTLEVVNAVRQEVGLQPVQELGQHDFEEVANLAEQRRHQAIIDLRQQVRDYHSRYEQQVVADFEGKEASVLPKIQKFWDKLEAQFSHIKTQFQDFPIGQTVWLVNLRNASTHYGVIQGYSCKAGEGANPVTLSSWKLDVLVADSLRRIKVPLSQVNKSLETGFKIQIAEETFLEGKDIYGLFDERQSLAREVRQVFTGNVLRAYEKFQGKLINFSDRQGGIRQGLLMPASFEVDKVLAVEPVAMPTAAQAIGFLQAYSEAELQTKDQWLTIRPQGRQGDRLVLTAPKDKTAGQRYFLNSEFLAALGTEFYSVGERMEAVVQAERLEPALEYLLQTGGGLFAFKQREQAREYLGIKLPSLQGLDLSTVSESGEEADFGVGATVTEEAVQQSSPVPAVESVTEEAVQQSSPVQAVELTWDQRRRSLVEELLIPEKFVNALRQVGLITADGYGERPLSQMGIGIDQAQAFWFQIGKTNLGRILLTETPLEALALASVDRRSQATVYWAVEKGRSLPDPDALRKFVAQGGSVQIAFGRDPQAEVHAWDLVKEVPAVRLQPRARTWSGQILNQSPAPSPQEWPKIAQALGHPDQYLQRIQSVLDRDSLTSEKAKVAFLADVDRFQSIQGSLWNWIEAAQAIGRSDPYQQRIIAVAQAFNAEVPQPMTEKAQLAMQGDLKAQLQSALTRPRQTQVEIG